MDTHLDFVAGWDLDIFRRDCLAHRELAQRQPVHDPNMILAERYHWEVGDWRLTFSLETFHKKPLWHGSVTVLNANYRTHPQLKIEVDQPRPLFTRDWDKDHFAQAKFLLAEMFGEIIRPNDDSQQAQETLGLLGMHWLVEHQGPRLWQKLQH